MFGTMSTHYISCDNCGKTEVARGQDTGRPDDLDVSRLVDLRNRCRSSGWWIASRDGSREAYCPECTEELDKRKVKANPDLSRVDQVMDAYNGKRINKAKASGYLEVTIERFESLVSEYKMGLLDKGGDGGFQSVLACAFSAAAAALPIAVHLI